MKVQFLGTGAGMPAKERNVSAIILNLLQESNELWLFDCGEATQHQILHTTIKPRKISKIFITHLHGDHIFGLPGFLSSRSFLGGDEPLTIYGPKGIKQFIETSLALSQTHLKYTLVIEEINEGVIFENNDYIIETIALDHNIESFGYKVIEKDKLGELNVEKLKELGIKPGPIYKKIKEQEETKLDNGEIIFRKDFLGPNKMGRKVVIFGDTRFNNDYVEFIQAANLLIHEATFSKENETLAKEYYHSTTSEAATLAKNANVDALIITHISSRYQDEEANKLLVEAKNVFSNSFIADDFYEFTIN